MRRFSYVFSTPNDDPHSVDVDSGIVAVLGTKLVKPSAAGATSPRIRSLLRLHFSLV